MTAHARVLELIRVQRHYPGSPTIKALDGVDLTIDRGELIAVVGPSGSGKSTLLNIMGSLDRPTTGSVRIDGVDASRLTDRRLAGLRAHRLGFVFQSFHLIESLSTEENVGLGLLYQGMTGRTRLLRAREALDRVGLGARHRATPSQLSGGERQRVAIARAIVGNPALVLADEPTGNLDSVNGAAILELLRDLNAQGSTIVIVTHDRDLAATLPRHVALLDGRIESDTGALVDRGVRYAS